jgi:hypothetical protein
MKSLSGSEASRQAVQSKILPSVKNCASFFLKRRIPSSWANENCSGSLAPLQRKAYTDAVLCLQNRTALTPIFLVPGVRTRVFVHCTPPEARLI